MVSFWVKQQQADLGQFVAAEKKTVVHWLNHPKIAKICKHHIHIFIYYIYLQFTVYAYENANIYMLGKTYPCGAMSSAGFGASKNSVAVGSVWLGTVMPLEQGTHTGLGVKIKDTLRDSRTGLQCDYIICICNSLSYVQGTL
jgi:hypothetical protein